jgi:hypothetical protein
MVVLKQNQMTRGSHQLAKKTMVELKLNELTHGRFQLVQKNHGRLQIKSNNLWQTSVSSKKL